MKDQYGIALIGPERYQHELKESIKKLIESQEPFIDALKDSYISIQSLEGALLAFGNHLLNGGSSKSPVGILSYFEDLEKIPIKIDKYEPDEILSKAGRKHKKKIKKELNQGKGYYSRTFANNNRKKN